MKKRKRMSLLSWSMKFPLMVLSCCVVLAGNAFAGDEDLVSLFGAKPSAEEWAKRVVPQEAPAGEKAEVRQKLKSIEAYGTTFTGEAALAPSPKNYLAVWCADHMLLPADAPAMFEKMARDLSAKLGQGVLITDIPNVKTRAMLWFQGDDVVLLQVQCYSRRANLSVVRENKATWRESMGAGEGEFWSKTLKKLESAKQK